MSFAELRKYLIYAHPCPFLYQVICICKSNMQFMRKPPPDRRLACPHKTCKDDVLHNFGPRQPCCRFWTAVTMPPFLRQHGWLAPYCFYANTVGLLHITKTSSNSPNNLYSFSLSHQENHCQIFLKRRWLSQGQPQPRRSQRQQAQRIYLTFPHLPEKTSWYLYPLTLTAYKASVSVSSQPLTGLVRRYSYRLQSRLHCLSFYKIWGVLARSFPSCFLPLVSCFCRKSHHALLNQKHLQHQIPYRLLLPLLPECS